MRVLPTIGPGDSVGECQPLTSSVARRRANPRPVPISFVSFKCEVFWKDGVFLYAGTRLE
jgi:hypothetical protein